ncbi:MAG: hypothetical protein PHV30_05905 [Candidatus Margulisbacteria bacterium]|nr:hypothetical protein [Candidatus Margulisiibacteriota bacterium]
MTSVNFKYMDSNTGQMRTISGDLESMSSEQLSELTSEITNMSSKYASSIAGYDGDTSSISVTDLEMAVGIGGTFTSATIKSTTNPFYKENYDGSSWYQYSKSLDHVSEQVKDIDSSVDGLSVGALTDAEKKNMTSAQIDAYGNAGKDLEVIKEKIKALVETMKKTDSKNKNDTTVSTQYAELNSLISTFKSNYGSYSGCSATISSLDSIANKNLSDLSARATFENFMQGFFLAPIKAEMAKAAKTTNKEEMEKMGYSTD